MRFAILLHHAFAGGHFDLLFEDSSGLLRTWRSQQWPGAAWTPAEPIELHRRVYLRYQGPVVGNGWVRRVVRGSYRELADSSEAFRIIVTSDKLNGILEFERDATRERDWRCRIHRRASPSARGR